MSYSLRGLAPLIVVALSACGGGGGGGSTLAAVNQAPTANFTLSCADLVCTFKSNSTDQDVGDAVVGFNWNFGDATVAATDAAPVHTFATAGDYNVSLTVSDRSGATGNIVRPVKVTAPATPAAPHANFGSSCVSVDCTFTDTSTYDTPSSVFASRSWDFGDSTAPATTSPITHSYAATTLTNFTAKLTVTDTNGKSSTSVQSVVVAPPATTLNCVGSSGGGNCTLTLTTASRVFAGLLSHSCAAQGNSVVITAPIQQVIFADGCIAPVGTSVQVGSAPFPASTQLQIAVVSGTVPATSLAFQPAIRVTGDFANGWTLTFDDGFGGPGEPDFNDLVIVIKATP